MCLPFFISFSVLNYFFIEFFLVNWKSHGVFSRRRVSVRGLGCAFGGKGTSRGLGSSAG